MTPRWLTSAVGVAGRDPAPGRALRLAALALTPLLPWLVAFPGGPTLLPLLAPLTLYPSFLREVRDRRYAVAWGQAMAWAALLSAGVILLVVHAPDLAARIIHGQAYRDEMFRWILSGTGKESTPSLFIPEHLLHLGAFLLLTLASGGYLGLVLGAFLVGYMSYFVGSFAVHADAPLAVASLVAWVPWSLVRVGAFVLFGVLLARPLLLRQAWPFGRRERWLLALATVGAVVDVVAKWLLAPWWSHLLRSLLRG